MNDIWNLMKKYRFDIVNDFNKNILCTICNGLLINAHSSLCGCVYCFDCIRDYLNGIEKVCPGKSDECIKKIININKNVFPDNTKNRNVLKTIVKCPWRNCVVENELKNIGDHIRICDYRSVECPFMNIGSKYVDVVETDLKTHLIEEIVSHSKFMLESIGKLTDETELLKKNLTTLTMENKDLKKEIIDLKEKNVSKELLLDEISKINNELKLRLEELERKCERPNEELREKIEIRRNEMEKERTDKIDKSISNIDGKLNEIDKNLTLEIGEEFEWRIEKWKERLECARSGIVKEFYSDPFYSHINGYKICLRVCPNGNGVGEATHLSVFFHLMRGDFDDSLSWPFKHAVTIQLIDQRTKQVHTSKTRKYRDDKNEEDKNRPSYQKPTKERNRGLGFDKFVTLSDLSNKIELCENDQLLFRCRVTII